MAEMHTLYSSLKRLLSFFNGFIVVSVSPPRGAVLTRVLGPSSAYLVHVGYLCLAIGCITVLLSFSFAGWYGATRESRGTLLYCFLFTVNMLTVEITIAKWSLPCSNILKQGTKTEGKLDLPALSPRNLTKWGTLLFYVPFTSCVIFEVQEVALEHIFVTLRKNYRGYSDPDDYSTEWSLAMEKVRSTSRMCSFVAKDA
uniref:Uncharacterized protein n=1 Tax=Canis lupus dingo TaxID=286419 RepID=A0A8C0QVA0_CANLU